MKRVALAAHVALGQMVPTNYNANDVLIILLSLQPLRNLPDHVFLVLFGVYILQEAVKEIGMQIGAAQQVLITQTELLLVQPLVLVQGSNREQITCGAHKEVLTDVSKR